MNKRFPFVVKTPRLGYAPAKWCLENIGTRYYGTQSDDNGTWHTAWCGPEDNLHFVWCFETEEAMLAFSLRWS